MSSFRYPLFRRCRQRGNALFLILIAVALFAALSYAMTQSGRGGGTISREKAVLLAAQIAQSAAAVRGARDRMILMGTPAASIIYGADPAPNNRCPGSFAIAHVNYRIFCQTGDDCLFAPEGGAAPLPFIPQEAFTETLGTLGSFGSYVQSTMIGSGMGPVCGPAGYGRINGIGTAADDLLLTFTGLRQEVCAALNAGLGISGIPVSAVAWGPIVVAALNGKPAGCFYYNGGANSRYTYYQVIAEN